MWTYSSLGGGDMCCIVLLYEIENTMLPYICFCMKLKILCCPIYVFGGGNFTFAKVER